MTFTYSDTSITTDLAKVRTIIGDTDSDDVLLTDEQINFQIDRTNSVDTAAIRCVKLILAKFAREMDRSGTRFNATRSQKFQQYKDLLAELTSDAAGSVLAAVWSGASQDDRDSVNADSDYVQPSFKIGQGENPTGSDGDT